MRSVSILTLRHTESWSAALPPPRRNPSNAGMFTAIRRVDVGRLRGGYSGC